MAPEDDTDMEPIPGEAPVEPDAEFDGGALDQATIDALMAGMPDAPSADDLIDDSPLPGSQGLDQTLAPPQGGPFANESSVSQDAIDALMKEAAASGADEADAEDGTFDQAAIDALLRGGGASPPPPARAPQTTQGWELTQSDLDALLTSDAADDVIGAEADAGAIDQAAIDAIMSGGAAPAAGGPRATGLELSQDDLDALEEPQAAEAEPSAADDLSQDLIDSILAEAAAPKASAGESPLLTQDMLDKLIADAQDDEPADDGLSDLIPPPEELEAAPQDDGIVVEEIAAAEDQGRPIDAEVAGLLSEVSAMAPPPEPEPKPKRQRRTAGQYLAEHGIKLAASILVGTATGAAVYTALLLNDTQTMDARSARRIPQADLGDLVAQARDLVAIRQYKDAYDLLTPAIASAEPSALRSDAEFLRIEAWYHGLANYENESVVLDLINAIGDFIVFNQTDPRAAQALYWQGQLYERQGIPFAAREVYERIVRSYAGAVNRDRVMLDIARISLDLDRPADAITACQGLIDEMPGSPLALEAKLLLGDAYLANGERSAAESVYRQLADTFADSPVAARAFGRLGDMAFQEGRYEDAIALLEERRQRATTTEGNDAVFHTLAQAYYAVGQLESAEEVLRELINFFGDSPLLPEAYVELAEVLDDRGRRDEAVQLATQAAVQFKDNPRVLRHTADMLRRAGEFRAAADMYEQAESAGAADAAVLLAAAQANESAGRTYDALDQYDRLLALYPGSPQTVEANIASADILYRQGQTSEALRRLENLALSAQDQPQRLPILMATARIYQDLGLHAEAARLYEEVSALSGEPEVRAKSAIALIQGRQLELGLTLAKEIPLDAIAPETAYTLLDAMGAALASIDPARSLAHLEEAYTRFPGQRTPEGDARLFRVYLAGGQTGKAREMLSALEAQVRQNPVLGSQLRRLAFEWAEFNYGRKDYREAIAAYTLVLDTLGGMADSDVQWARYQRANARYFAGARAEALGDYLAIASTASPWSNDARQRAETLQLETRLRHEPPLEPPVEAPAEGPAAAT